MAEVKPLYVDAAGFPTELDPTADTITIAGLTMNGNIDANSNKVINLAAGTLDSDAVTKNQLDTAVITGGTVRERIICADQLDDVEGIRAAMGLRFVSNPVSGDTITITDGTTTRTYGADSGGDVQYAIGVNNSVTMDNFAQAVTGDGSGAWNAAFSLDGLDEFNPTGLVVIYARTTGGAASLTRTYANWATQGNIQVYEYSDGVTVDTEYSVISGVTAATSDPGSGRVGFERAQASLVSGEIHSAIKEDNLYSWDDSTNVWVTMTGPNSIPDAQSAVGGSVKGKVTFDSGKGLGITGGIGEVILHTVSGLEFGPTNTGIRIKLETTDPTLDINSNELGVKFAGTGSALTQDATGLLVNVDGTSIGINGSNQLEVLNAGEASRVENTYNVDAAVDAGDPVYFSSNDEVTKAVATDDTSRQVIGVARTAQATIGQPTEVVGFGPAAGVLTGATAGDEYYLAAAGGLTTTAPSGSGNQVVLIGWAINATDLYVDTQYLGKKA